MIKEPLSDKAKKNIGYIIIIALSLFSGITLLTASNKKNITENDIIEIQVSYERINRFDIGDGDYYYNIYTTNDKRVYNISSIICNYFQINSFNNNVKKDDVLKLIVIKYNYENNKNPIDVLGVQKDETIFLDYSKTFNRLKNNDAGGFIIGIIFSSAGIIGTIWFIYFNKKKQNTIDKND